jgi:hypothetical protein
VRLNKNNKKKKKNQLHRLLVASVSGIWIIALNWQRVFKKKLMVAVSGGSIQKYQLFENRDSRVEHNANSSTHLASESAKDSGQ